MRAPKAQNPVYFADTRYLADARRFDMGERDHFISMEMAAIGMEMIANWGAGAVVARLSALMRRISYDLTSTNVLRPDDRFRAPHILCLRFRTVRSATRLRSSRTSRFTWRRASGA
jgi:hypothetical protein